MKIPGIMIAATASGSGKTAVTCALMEALVKKGIGVAACKCGPDYIDPMFHRNVLGIDSENLDLFFCEKEQLRSCFTRHASNADAAVIEGVMGYYDGMGLGTEEASSYDVARTLGVPVILVLPCRGMALSILAVLKGMLEFRNDSHISGIILNRISPSLYPKMKEMIVHGLREMGHDVKVLGYVPEHPAFQLESRHLGLILPEEIADLKKQIEEAAEILEKSVDLDAVLSLMDSDVERKNSAESEVVPGNRDAKEPVTIAVARDAAFCFYYKENLEILKTLGCRLVWFSPLEDSKMPEEADGILLGGGYPEIYARQLSANASMRQDLKEKLNQGMPCIAECGGFLYLLEQLQGTDKSFYPMVGLLEGSAEKKERLIRFGYMNVRAEADGCYLRKGECIRGHEFHYWEAQKIGEDCLAEKPDGRRSWREIHMKNRIFAGFPHLYWGSNPEFAVRFVKECQRRRKECRRK